MKKIVLKADLLLDAADKTPGLTGQELLAVQNATGGHIVTLAPGNEGIIDVGRQPGCVTLLKYRNDDTKSYWTSEILTPELILNQPSRILNLSVYIVDSNGAKLRWSAPQGNPPTNAPATRYRIYFSESEIDINYSVSDFPEFKQTLLPKAPGSQEELVMGNLLPGHKYYCVIVSESLIFGKLRVSGVSNVVSIITPANDAGGGLAPRIIPLVPENFFPNGMIIDTDPDTGNKMHATNLADISTIIDNGGIPEGVPPTPGMGIINFGVGDMPQYNRPSWDCLIDMGAQWTIEYIYVWLTTNGEIDIKTSNNGVVFDNIATLNNAIPHGSWQKVIVNPLFSQNIRFLQLAFKTKQTSIKGFLLYGKRAQKATIKGVKYKKTVPERTFDEFLGTNAFLLEDHDQVRKVSKMTRFYVESDWLFRKNGNWDSQGEGEGKTADQVRFVFASSHIWNFDQKMFNFKASGQTLLFTLNNSPLYLRPAGYDSAVLAKPVDPGLNPIDLNVTTDPQSYKHYARLAFNLAARYGRNMQADPQFIQLDEGEPADVGLNLLEYIEFGNEKDAYWTGANGYHSAHEMAAIQSAIYDGHKGLLGAGYGFKTADPTMKITMSSLALGDNIGYVKAMMLWWDLNRAPGDYPIDAINIHHYNASGGSQTGGNSPSSGIPPEEGEFINLMGHWHDFRSRQLQKCEIILSEIGYDEHWGGVYSPGYRDQAVRSKYKAYWLPRTFILAKSLEVDVLNQYWFGNTAVRLLVDVNPNYSDRAAFLTSGYTDGIDKADDFGHRVPLTSYWYAACLHSALQGYSFSHVMIAGGESAVNEKTIDSADPRVWAFAFTHPEQGSLVITWLGSVGFQSHNTKIYVGAAESIITVQTIDQAEVRQSEEPLTTQVNVQNDAFGKFIPLTINECPVIIKTMNIGTRKLIDPIGFMLEAVSNNTIKLVWRDKNIGANHTKIYQSALPDQGFNEVFSGYIDNGEHIFTDLSEGDNYFYKIAFQNGAIASNLSPTIGIKTLSTLAAPGNFIASAITSNSITMGFTYSLENQNNIDLFEIYRSTSANGIYVLLSTINKAQRTYTDNGLTSDTQYFYKVRAKKDFGYSDFTFSPGTTTGTVVITPPALVSVKTNYAGDRLKLVFDMAMANPAGQELGFGIIETTGGVPANINAIKCVLDSVDSKIIYVYLQSLIATAGSAVTLSYNDATSNVQSAAGTKLATFNSVVVANNKGNATLLTRKIQINLTDAANLAGAGWNDIVININGENTPADAQVYTKNLKDVNDVATNIEFIMPQNSGEGIINNGYQEGDMHLINDPNFPAATNNIAVGIANLNYGGATSLAIFQNLDPAKEYNLRALLVVYKYNTATRLVYYKNWQATGYLNKNLPGLSTYITSMKTVNTPYNPAPSGGGYPVVDHINDPKVGMHFQTGNDPVWIAGFILEEVTPE